MSSNYAKPYLITRNLIPENQETPIHFHYSDIVNKNLFYRRNHFPYPSLSLSNYWIPVSGSVTTPTLFSIQDIQRLPSKTVKFILECSGNKRNFFEPKVFGEQWEKGAISQGYWRGVPLKSLLEIAGVKDHAEEVIIEGYDFGERKDINRVVPYKRSLPIEKALHTDTLLAYQYNNQPIPFKHGFPFRLIVPQWYAMASVKWVKQITITSSSFTGPFQSIDYVYYPNKNNNNDARPVTHLNVNSTIQKPLDMEILNTGIHKIKGIAWTGKGNISKVEISTDNGKTWTETSLEKKQESGYHWITWSYNWTVLKKGEYTILSKATDSFDRIQPEVPFWNRKGYGYNAIDKVKVKVE